LIILRISKYSKKSCTVNSLMKPQFNLARVSFSLRLGSLAKPRTTRRTSRVEGIQVKVLDLDDIELAKGVD